jgi:opacity protein-like surface antigen
LCCWVQTDVSGGYEATQQNLLPPAPNDNMLTYLTGGLAVSNISLAQSILLSAAGPTLAGSVSSAQLGWTAGGAVEYALSWNWFIKAEYLYVSFSNQTAGAGI